MSDINIKRGEFFSIIPARSGSKTILHKNIRDMCGFPMIAYSIASSLMCKYISRTIITTDSEQYAEIACKYGAETPFLRPAKLSEDSSTDLDFMLHVIHWFNDNEGAVPEYWVHLRPVCPVRDNAVVNSALELFLQNTDCDCMRSCNSTTLFPHKWFVLTDDQKYFKPLMPGVTVADTNNPRQSFPTIYTPSSYIDVLKTSFIIENNAIHGKNMLAFITDAAIDIDFEEDFVESAKYVRQTDAYEYLKRKFGK